MGTQERTEREINLGDLFWKILQSWRKVICFGLLFAVLVSGLRYFLSVRSYHASQDTDVEMLREELKAKDLEQLTFAVSMQKRIDDFENYQKKSLIMQIDPYAKPVIELQYYLQSDYIINYAKDSEHDYTSELISMYSNYITGGEMAKSVIEQLSLPISQEDFVELVSVVSPRGDDRGTIYFTVSYADDENLQKISDAVKSLLEKKTSDFQEVGSHKLQLINESKSTVVDTVLADRKNAISNTVTTLRTQLKNIKESLSDEQLALFDMEVREMRGEDLEEMEEPGFSIMYMVLGAMLGIFLVCAWAACKMIFAVRLQSSEEMGRLYGVRLLGEIAVPGNGKKRFLSVIDDFILRLKNRRKKKTTTDQQIEVISANVALSCKKHGFDSVFMTGSEYERADKALLDKLKQKLKGCGIKIQDGGNMLYDVPSLNAGMENGHIILVEQLGMSTYDEIYAELNLIKEYQGEVLGVIVLG